MRNPRAPFADFAPGSGGGDPFAQPRIRPGTRTRLATLAVLFLVFGGTGVVFMLMDTEWMTAGAEGSAEKKEAGARAKEGEEGAGTEKSAAVQAGAAEKGEGKGAGESGPLSKEAARLSAGGEFGLSPWGAGRARRRGRGDDPLAKLSMPKLESILQAVKRSDRASLAEFLDAMDLPSTLKEEIVNDPAAAEQRARALIRRYEDRISDR